MSQKNQESFRCSVCNNGDNFKLSTISYNENCSVCNDEYFVSEYYYQCGSCGFSEPLFSTKSEKLVREELKHWKTKHKTHDEINIFTFDTKDNVNAIMKLEKEAKDSIMNFIKSAVECIDTAHFTEAKKALQYALKKLE